MKRLPGSNSALALALAVALAGPAAAQARRSATLKVVGAAPQASVIVDGIRHGRADASGARTVASLSAGRHAVVVRQVGFVDHRETVTLAAGRTAVVRPKRVPLTEKAELAFQRGDDLRTSGRSRLAVPELETAIAARGGRYPEAEIGLARAYLAIKETDRASATIGSLLEAQPRNVEALTVSGNILRERGLYDEAAAAYRKAIEIAPGRAPEAYTGLAIVLDEHGKREEAIEAFRRAIAQNADAEPLLYQLLGHSLEELGRAKEAIRAYDRFLELAPQSTLAPAVRSVVERLRAETVDDAADESGDVNPYAPQ